ncbi:MAG TPA: alternative ribosome rescue aminoacyl-tRNA hydrolase ArfB [Armatimonadota bacterium]|nr:alternative ribosome rescue aminoacyl-tRNA hydrolase ArfB [Armatimonadota bacterium]
MDGADDILIINDALAIPRGELAFRTSRSGGPGGQHVNKTETRVELLFDTVTSPSLTDLQRALLLATLGSAIDDAGVIHVVSERYRSQLRNREDAVAKFVALLHDALRPVKRRKPTRIPKGVREARLKDKRQRGEIKRERRRRPEEM